MDRFAIALSPEEFEQAIAEQMRIAGAELTDLVVVNCERLEGVDGDYIIDATARFSAFGVRFLVLVECKSGAKPVEREAIQVLRDKVGSGGAHKGMLVATSHFQRGAVEYAERHGIALVFLQDGSFNYIVKADGLQKALRGGYAAALARIPEDGSDGVLYTNLDQGEAVGASLILKEWAKEAVANSVDDGTL